MFLNVLLFNFFPQAFLLWHQLLIHCQDSSAVFLMPFIFVPDMFGTWGAGKEAGATVPLLPSNSIFPYGLEPWCKPTSCLGSKCCSSLPIMRWTASQVPPLMTQHSCRHSKSQFQTLQGWEAEGSLLFPSHLLCSLELCLDKFLCI